MSVCFRYHVKGNNEVRTEIDETSACLAMVDIETDTVIDLIEEMLTEWDMLTNNQREDLKMIAGRILDMANE